jgi:hypothetical protein
MSHGDAQLSLFLVMAGLADAQRRRSERELRVVESRAAREVAVAIGQVGDQLALALWSGERLAKEGEQNLGCASCGRRLRRALDEYRTAPRGRHRARVLPLCGTVD